MIKDKIKVTPQQILEIVCEEYGVDISDLKKKTRIEHIVTPRQIAHYLIRKYCPSVSLENIKNIVGGAGSHSTVIHSCGKVEDFSYTDTNYRNRLHDVEIKVWNAGLNNDKSFDEYLDKVIQVIKSHGLTDNQRVKLADVVTK